MEGQEEEVLVARCCLHCIKYGWCDMPCHRIGSIDKIFVRYCRHGECLDDPCSKFKPESQTS